MTSKYYLIYLLSLIFAGSFAATTKDSTQTVILLYVPVKETYLITSVNVNQFSQIDNMVSPLVYKGIGAGVTAGLQRRKKERFTSFNTHWSSSKLYNNIQPKQYYAELSHVNVNLASCYLIKRFQNNKIRSYYGWQLAHQSDFRRNAQLQNSSLSYNFSTSLSPALRFEKWLSIKENNQRKLFKKQRSIRISYQLAVPLIASISRPPYNAIRILHDGSGNAYQNSVTQEVINQSKLYTLNQFIAVNSNLSLEYFLKNGTRLSIQYYWNYENFSKMNSSYKVSQSGFQLSLHTRLNAL